VRWIPTTVAAFTLFLQACGGGSGGAPTSELVIHTDRGEVVLDVEVADDADERSVGLMNREDLGSSDGMAFLWDEPVRASFWMKDTLIPLSIAFWTADGEIVSIMDMEPCEADPCPTYDPGTAFVGALEVERGAFDDRGVEVGDRVEVDGA
jgi:uncharacterized membrane protein (UPF0127 family)